MTWRRQDLREGEKKRKRFYIPRQDDLEKTRLAGRREEEEEVLYPSSR
jgi:hypothetical protein